MHKLWKLIFSIIYIYAKTPWFSKHIPDITFKHIPILSELKKNTVSILGIQTTSFAQIYHHLHHITIYLFIFRNAKNYWWIPVLFSTLTSYGTTCNVCQSISYTYPYISTKKKISHQIWTEKLPILSYSIFLHI